LIYFFFPPIT